MAETTPQRRRTSSPYEAAGSRPKTDTVPSSGRERTGDHADGGGLAGTVGAEQDGDPALGDLDGEIGQGLDVTEPAADARDIGDQFR